LSKAKRRPTPGKTSHEDTSVSGALKRDDIMPGDKISMDQYHSSVRGRLKSTYGRERESNQYIGGTRFVDHASGLILTHHQPTLGSSDTLRSLAHMESFFAQHNVPIKRFHTDNGISTSSEFRQRLSERHL
jgi:transposase InsO family protein